MCSTGRAREWASVDRQYLPPFVTGILCTEGVRPLHTMRSSVPSAISLGQQEVRIWTDSRNQNNQMDGRSWNSVVWPRGLGMPFMTRIRHIINSNHCFCISYFRRLNSAPNKICPSSNPQYLWMGPYLEIESADVIKDIEVRSAKF